MIYVNSTVTELPRSCKSAAERMAKELEREDAYASLTEDRKSTRLNSSH